MKAIPKTATRPEIINLLKERWGIKTKRELAAHIEVSESSLGHYSKRRSNDIQTNIILELLRDIEYLEKQIP